ncbi:hypothetical protein MPER_10889, partial [Moniliophthora perniciosa FA553]
TSERLRQRREHFQHTAANCKPRESTPEAELKTMASNSPTPPKEDEKDATSTLKSREAMERRRSSEPTKSKKSKKRKNGDDDAEPASKKTKIAPLPSTNLNIAAASRAVISSLAMEEAKRKASMSDAVKSLYGDGKERKETFTTRAVYHRVTL